MGSPLVRWTATEAGPYHGGAAHHPGPPRIAERRGRKITRVAAAGKLLTLVYYGMRDGASAAWRRRDESPAQPRRGLDQRRDRVAGLMAPTTRHVLLRVRLQAPPRSPTPQDCRNASVGCK